MQTFYAAPSGVSSNAAVEIAPGKEVGDFTATEMQAKQRIWRLNDTVLAANLPENPSRAFVWITNKTTASNACIVWGAAQNPAATAGIPKAGPGQYWEGSVAADQITKGAISIVMDNDSATEQVTVLEASFI